MPETGIPALIGLRAIVGLYLLFAIRMANQWERIAVLRFGRYIGLRGPGPVSRTVDPRVRVASVSAESTLTRDTVLSMWMRSSSGWYGNAEKAILEVQDFDQAISMSAQTGLRESISRHEFHQMVAERELLGKTLLSLCPRCRTR